MATFIEGDLADANTVDTILAEHKPDAIMHFASHTLVGESMEKPFRYIGENITNGLNLLQGAVKHNVRQVYFILNRQPV
jgi:UDP-glucose 4-epimerase